MVEQLKLKTQFYYENLDGKMNYFLLSWKHVSEVASAYYNVEEKSTVDLILSLEGRDSMPYKFDLKKIKETEQSLTINDDINGLKEMWLDYQPNNLLWPLMSEKLKKVIERHQSGNEGTDWIKCKISGNKEEKTYYILRFNNALDVLDFAKTIFVKETNHIIKPVFSLPKIAPYCIFTKPYTHHLGKITSALYVSEKLKKAITQEGISGIAFEKISVS